MKFALILLAALACGARAQTASAQNPAAADAKALYDSGRYAAAAQAFEAEARRSPYDAALHYDLGNALLKGKQNGRAVASYLRAFQLDPRDEDIRFNLDFALRRVGDSLYADGVPRGLWLAFNALSMTELQGLHWLMFWLALLLASAYVLKEGLRETLSGPLWAAVLVWAVLAGWWTLRVSAWPQPLAVTVAPQTELRNGPGENFSVGFTAPEGHRLRVLEDRGEWLEVGLLKEGVKGWVKKEEIEKV